MNLISFYVIQEFWENSTKKKEVNLFKKEESYAFKLLLKNKKYINKEENSENIKLSLIELLQDLVYKSKSEFKFFKKDKINFTKLLYKEGIIKSRKNQEKNKQLINQLGGKIDLFDKYL